MRGQRKLDINVDLHINDHIFAKLDMRNCLTLLRPVHLNLTLLKYLTSNLLGQFCVLFVPGLNHKHSVTAFVRIDLKKPRTKQPSVGNQVCQYRYREFENHLKPRLG